MTIERWDPRAELARLQQEMTRLLEVRRLGGDEPVADAGWQPAVDIYEDAATVVVKMDLTEVEQHAIDVRLDGETLVIQGERLMETVDGRHYHRLERGYGPFRRLFALPATVARDAISACCERGVLRVVLPKRSAPPPRQIEVEVR